MVDQIAQNRALLWSHTVPTMKATLADFACSVTVAFILSVILDFMPRVRRALFPIFVISQTLPLVAIAPLVVLWCQGCSVLSFISQSADVADATEGVGVAVLAD